MLKLIHTLSAALLATVAAFTAVGSAQAAAHPVWTMTAANNSVVTAVNHPDGSAVGTYLMERTDDVFRTQTWTFSTVAPETRNYEFSWDYSGFHSFYRVYVELAAFGGAMGDNTSLWAPEMQDCCVSPSAGFTQQGTVDFGLMREGEKFGFTMLGRNYDGTRVLQGELALHELPEPASCALAGVGLMAVGWLRRKSVVAGR